jgi:hypothetical protein
MRRPETEAAMATIESATEIRPFNFAAWQEPDIFTTEVRAAFRSLHPE